MTSTQRLRLPLPPGSDLVNPIVKAYGFAYLSSSSLQLVRLVPLLLSGRKDLQYFKTKAVKILGDAAGTDGLSAYAAMLVAASTLGPRALAEMLQLLQGGQMSRREVRVLANNNSLRFISVFVAGLGVFRILNRSGSKSAQETERTAAYTEAFTVDPSLAGMTPLPTPAMTPISEMPSSPISWEPPAGKTLFVTSFAVIYATVVSTSLTMDRFYHTSHHTYTLRRRIKEVATVTGFAACSAIIMWKWVFWPEHLPKDYVKWITSAAGFDDRILDIIRKVRQGKISYGRQGSVPHLLGELCSDLNLPQQYGDYTKTIPIPCHLLHLGMARNCEQHAAKRFVKGWVFAFRLYMLLNLAVLLRQKPTTRRVGQAVLSASRSAAFLGAFICSFYYGVCLGRSRIGPAIGYTSKEQRTAIEGKWAPGLACALCGWSILLERSSRRPEMALFVAPRALRALLPEKYDRKWMPLEQNIFASSIALVLTAAAYKPRAIHGVFGKLLGRVYGK